MPSKYATNEDLITIKTDWPGTPVDEEGRFVNHEFPFTHSFNGLLKWKLRPNPQAEEKKNDHARVAVLNPAEFLAGNDDGLLWLGHASFYIRINGTAILIDPVFGTPRFLFRLMDVPSPLEKIKKLDYILLSHDHRDHTDRDTIRQLAKIFPKAQILAGLGMETILGRWTGRANTIQTAGWYQQFDLKSDIKITFLPARHWAKRGAFDTNRRLWGAFHISDGKRSIYFSGDTGYGSHFAELSNLFPPIDYFIVGIGAYSPRWFMTAVHISPEDAVRAFLESKSVHLVPMHFGTFDLTNEPPSEPLRLLLEAAAGLKVVTGVRDLPINGSLAFQGSGLTPCVVSV